MWLALQFNGSTVGHKLKALVDLARGGPVLAGVTKCLGRTFIAHFARPSPEGTMAHGYRDSLLLQDGFCWPSAPQPAPAIEGDGNRALRR